MANLIRITTAQNTTLGNTLQMYRLGCIPFGDECDDVNWYTYSHRYIFDLQHLNVPRSLRREVLTRKPYEITIDKDFPAVMEACATVDGRTQPERRWLNGTLQRVFNELHEQGHAHSVECWREGKLAGGLYGLAIGRIFFGESRFTAEKPEGGKYDNASKIALVHLAARLWYGGFEILDSQTGNRQLEEQMGLMPITHASYEAMLPRLTNASADFNCASAGRQDEITEKYIAFLRARNAPARGFKP